MKIKKLTKKQLNILYECWKEVDTTKERLALIEERLPKVPSLAALSVMRKMAKTDSRWLKMATRKKNQKEKEKLQKKKEREAKIEEKETKRKIRELKRTERNKALEQKITLNNLRSILKKEHFDLIAEKIESDFFFCSDTHQFVNNISCVFRIFSDDHILSRAPQCEKCIKFNKYVKLLEETINDTRLTKKTTKGASRNKTSKGGSEDKKQQNKTTKKTNRETKNDARC